MSVVNLVCWSVACAKLEGDCRSQGFLFVLNVWFFHVVLLQSMDIYIYIYIFFAVLSCLIDISPETNDSCMAGGDHPISIFL